MDGHPDDFDLPMVDLPPSVSTSPESTIRFLIAELAQAGRLAGECVDRVFQNVLDREGLGSPGIGQGLAIPHAKSEFVTEVVGLLGRSQKPISWPGTVDGNPVHWVCLLLIPTSDSGGSLRALHEIVCRLRAKPQD